MFLASVPERPRKMIERMYGAEVFFEEAINIAFPEAYEAAAEQEKLQIVGYPTVEMVGEVTKDGFTFKATTLCILRSLWASTRA